MSRASRSLLLAAVLLAGCGSGKQAAQPLSPRAYLDHALELMQADAVYVPRPGWAAVTAEARSMASSATTPSDTYAAIRYAIGRLRETGDLHAEFTSASMAKLRQPGAQGNVATPPPSVSLAAPRIGLIVVSPIMSALGSAEARRYASRALVGLTALQERDRPCGWIVDLRSDPGGDMWPMLLAVGPILGSGRVIGFTGGSGSIGYVTYRDGLLSGGGYTSRAAPTVPDFAPAPPVAVLTSENTLSSGEAVAIAFRGRPNTRSFGSATGGATNSARLYLLPDGATIFLSTHWDVDRGGRVYKQSIVPDVLAPGRGGIDDARRAAVKWLLSTSECRAGR